MAKTVVELSVPFTFVSAGEYKVKINGLAASISIIVEQHQELAKRVFPDLNFAGTITSFPADHHGIFEITKVKIEFPYLIEPTKVKETVGVGKTIETDSIIPAVEAECLTYLNRLIEVVKFHKQILAVTPVFT